MPLPVPASTVAIICDTDEGIKILMVLRNQNLAAAGGSWAFPGGRVEEQDYQDTSDHYLAAQCAAVRETVEETGLCIELKHLTAFAHWTTPSGPPRRYATWFFLTELASPSSVQVAGSGIVDHCGLGPREVLERHRNGKMQITPPGFVTLSTLKTFDQCQDVLHYFSQREATHFNPRLISTDTGRVVLYEGDAGYKNKDVNAPGNRNRVTIDGNDWHYENSDL